MHLIPTGPFSRWLLCTSEVRKDELFFLYCPGELRRTRERERERGSCVLLCSCSPPLVTAWLVSIQPPWETIIVRVVWRAALLCVKGEPSDCYSCGLRTFLWARGATLKKNLVLLASLLSLPIPPRQASDVKGSEVIAQGRVFSHLGFFFSSCVWLQLCVFCVFVCVP